MTARRVVVVALVYVLPLGLTAVFLVRAGLGLLAAALLAVEAVVLVSVALARRPPRTAGPATPRDGAQVLLAVGGVVLLTVVALVLTVGRR